MKKHIQPVSKPLNATVNIPGSKSITNRALLLAALADGVSEISSILISDDTNACIDALRQLGVMIQYDPTAKVCIVGGCSGRFPKNEASIHCHDAGTVARFLLAACAASQGKYFFDASQRLRERPISPLLNALQIQGVTVEPDHAAQMPFTILGHGGLSGGEIEIDGSQSGQFASALLMIAPFAQTQVVLKTAHLVSRSYIDLTCAMMAEFGVQVKKFHQERYVVPVPQMYTARDYVVEPDFSTASYFFAAAAVTDGTVTIQPVDIQSSKQGDVCFLKILTRMGCDVTENSSGITVKGTKELEGVSVDMRNGSDTFMTLAAIAPFAKTPTTITNIGHTRWQESNRISVMCEQLQKLKVNVEEGNDWIRIYPGQPVAGVIDAHNDHRIAMAFSVIGLRVGVEIEGAECVAKTCPEFFEMWGRLQA